RVDGDVQASAYPVVHVADQADPVHVVVQEHAELILEVSGEIEGRLLAAPREGNPILLAAPHPEGAVVAQRVQRKHAAVLGTLLDGHEWKRTKEAQRAGRIRRGRRDGGVEPEPAVRP